jgi:hypothetical protein
MEEEEEKKDESGGPTLLTPEDYTRRLSELRKKTNNPLFKNKLIRDLSESSDMKKFLDSKDIQFETLSEFTHGGFIDKYTQDELYQRIGSICGNDVGRRYRANSLDAAIFSMNPTFDILFLRSKTGDSVLGFIVAELGECAKEPNVYAVNLICSQSGLGKLLLGACLYCIKYNDDVSEKRCILELAHAYKNTPGFFMYTKLGFNLDDSLIGKEGVCFDDFLHLPMSVTLNGDKFTQQYFVDMMVRSDFKQADVVDPSGIYDLGLPKKESEDGGKSSAIQKEMVKLANILRKIKVFGTKYIIFPQDEWEIIKEMPFAKKRIFLNKPRSQVNFSKKVNAKPELVEPLLDEMVRDFDKLKRDYMRSKGIDIPLTPTAQLEIPVEEDEDEQPVLTEIFETVVPASPVETLNVKRTTSRVSRVTARKSPTTQKRKTTTQKRKTTTQKRKTTTQKRKTTTQKRKTTISKPKYDMRTLRSTYNTRKRTQQQHNPADTLL